MSCPIDRILEKVHKADDAIKERFVATIDGMSKEGLTRLLLEEYQLSKANAPLLLSAYNQTKNLGDKGISNELMRNYNEEKPHAPLFAKALLQLGINVESDYIPYQQMADYLNQLQAYIDKCPSEALGAIYYGEACAVQEMELMREVALRLEQLTGLSSEKAVSFFDSHLDGLEQSHSDELAAFLRVEDGEVGEIDYKQAEMAAMTQIAANEQLWLQIIDQAAVL